LLSILAEKQPRIGDKITITFTGIEKLNGGKTLKLFEVQIAAAVAVADEEIL
jgi:hypothetical protein